MTLKRPLAAAGAAALLSLTLTACGGDSPTDASVKEFCSAAGSSANAGYMEAVKDKDYKKLADLIKEDAKKVEEVGTPKDISKEAREGFEIRIKQAKKVNASMLEKAMKSGTSGDNPFPDDVSESDLKKVEAFASYEAKTCGGGNSVEVPSDLPTDLPSGLPTGLPSGMPTELPSDLASMMSGMPSNLDEMMSGLPTSPEELESYLSEMAQQ